jgi:hypothetical protein
MTTQYVGPEQMLLVLYSLFLFNRLENTPILITSEPLLTSNLFKAIKLR